MKQWLDNNFIINHKKDENGDFVVLLTFSTFSGPQDCIAIVINIYFRISS